MKKLIELAEKATPGKWSRSFIYISAPAYDTGSPVESFHVAMVRGWGHLQYLEPPGIGEKIQESNAEYIAAACPANLLPILCCAERMAEALKKIHAMNYVSAYVEPFIKEWDELTK